MDGKKETPPASAAEGADQNNIVYGQPSDGATPSQLLNMSFASNYHNIPAELRERPQWVCWCLETVNGRQTKVPYNPVTGHKASSTNRSSWSTFDAARDAVATKGMTGIGFVLTNDDPYTGIDIDDKKDNPASEHERAVHSAILSNVASYTERSPGERWRDEQGNERGGYHVIVRGRLDSGRDRGHVGVYSSGRYLTFTGDAVRNTSIADYQLFIDNMASQMPASTGIELENVESSRSDADIHDMACNASNGDKYEALCTGDWRTMGYPSQSEADFALLSIIGFYTPSNDQVRRIFRCTGLGKRDKATKDDRYLNASLKKVRAKPSTNVDLAQFKADAANLIARAMSAAQTLTDAGAAPEPLRRSVAPSEPYPVGSLGPTLGYAVNSIERVVKAPRAVCASSVLAAASLATQHIANVEVDGRSYPLSLSMLTIAESGERKSAVDKETLRPARIHEKAQIRIYEAKCAERKEAKKTSANSDNSSGGGDADEPEPQLPYILIDDFTYEGVFKQLQKGQPSIGLFADEGAQVFGGHGMSKENERRCSH